MPDAVWVVRAGNGGEHSPEFKERGVVALGFAPEPHRGESVVGMSRDQIKRSLRRMYADRSEGAIGQFAAMLDRFANDVSIGDLVLTPGTPLEGRDIDVDRVMYGTVASDYYFATEPIVHYSFQEGREAGRLTHFRDVEWRGTIARRDLPSDTLSSLKQRRTFFPAADGEAVSVKLSRSHRQ